MASSHAQLDSLDDSTLLSVLRHLNPFPDRFNCALCSRRLRDLALDRRSWLFVTHLADPSDTTSPQPAQQQQQQRRRRSLQAEPSAASLGTAGAGDAAGWQTGEEGDRQQHLHWYRSQFASLEAALAASRPGDTILLEAGPEPHTISSPLAVHHPVHILGGGAEAAECVVEGAKGIEALLDFRASGRLANLTLRATAGACVAHTCGRLTVQGCTLECDARGLPHLAAPLLTRAVSGPPPPLTPAALPGSKGQLPPFLGAAGAAQQSVLVAVEPAVGQKRTAAAAAVTLPAKRACTWLSAASAAAAGAGVLRVVETRIKAQGLAVDLQGSGQLAGVRAIYSTGHALVWLEVDSANCKGAPGSSSSRRAALPALAGAPVADEAALPGQPPFGWSSVASNGTAAASQAAIAMVPGAVPGSSLPSWLAKAAAAGFDAAAFQQKAQQLAAVAPVPQTVPAVGQGQQHQQGSSTAASLDEKAEAWCSLHHSTLAPPPEAGAVARAHD